MKHSIAVIVAVSLAATSCSLIRTKMKVEDVVAEKVKIESTTNLAKKYLILNDLKKKSVVLNNVLVKEITVSTNIDYEFCIIAEFKVDDKKVECHIYTKNMYKISNLQEGVSRINAVGDFRRFFTMLDEYYTKIEIVQAKVTLYDPAKDKAKQAPENKDGNNKPAEDTNKDAAKKADDKKQGGARP